MLLLAGSPLFTGTVSVLVAALTVLIVGLVLHRSRTVPVRTTEEQLQRLTMKVRQPMKYRARLVREWFG